MTSQNDMIKLMEECERLRKIAAIAFVLGFFFASVGFFILTRGGCEV